jgi:hypothetical protein
MKARRKSPLAIAAAALVAAPPAVAEPMSLAPPAAETQAPAPAQQAVTPPPPSPRAAAAIPPAAPAQTGPMDLHGPASALPDHLSLSAPPPAPPPAPTAAATPPAPGAAPTAPVQAAAAAAATPPAPRIAPAPTATVSAGVQDQYTRLVFRFDAGAATVTPDLTGNRLDLRFSRAADIDLSDLRAAPPRLIREIRKVSAAGAPLRLQLTLDTGVLQRHFSDGDRVVVDLLPPAPGTQQASADGRTIAPVPAQAPVSGVAHVQLVEEANDTLIAVTWPSPARAAAFRRGEAIWLLFDANGRIDLTGVARAGRRHQDIEIVRGENVTGLRIPAPPEMVVSAQASANAWTFTLAANAAMPDPAPLERQISADGRGRLLVHFGREGSVRWINDPEIGDRIAVALMGGPSKGVITRRATVEAEVLPSAQGAVVEPHADGVTVTLANGDLTVTRGDGLLAEAGAPTQSSTQAQLSAAIMQSQMDVSAPVPVQPEMSLSQVRHRIDALERRAADEGVMAGAQITARMDLARFLLRNNLAPEALGALRLASVNQGDLVEVDPEYRLLRGEASAMMGRYADADADLSVSALEQNPAAALWRGYAAAQRQDWAIARQQLEAGAGAMEELQPAWRARFELALAQATLELNDYAAAQAAVSAALGQAADQQTQLEARLVQARLTAAQGDNTTALQLLDALSRSPDEEAAVRATLEAIRIRRATGVMRAVDAVEPLEALRFRWRGDAIELTTVSMLGDVYSELGRWRDALATMRVAADRFPEAPAARQLRADMQTLFERLFLDGEADQMQPIEALGLFYEFADLTPVGPNGDRMVRLLAGRLVSVDLLEQAAQLLQHQVDERLQGMAKAQVAADLAAIYLMDHKPDRALVAIDTTRQPNMPPTLLADRRILEARALLDLGRLDAAVELVERDRSDNAQRVRAEAAWRARDWDRASAELRTLLGMRQASQPLDEDGRQQVLRLAVALTLKGDDDAVHALYRQYAGDMAHTDEADAFEVVASGINADGAAIRDVARAVARTDLLDRFMQHLRDGMSPPPGSASSATAGAPTAPGQTPPPQPPAAPPPAQAAAPAQPRPNAAAGA